MAVAQLREQVGGESFCCERAAAGGSLSKEALNPSWSQRFEPILAALFSPAADRAAPAAAAESISTCARVLTRRSSGGSGGIGIRSGIGSVTGADADADAETERVHRRRVPV